MGNTAKPGVVGNETPGLLASCFLGFVFLGPSAALVK